MIAITYGSFSGRMKELWKRLNSNKKFVIAPPFGSDDLGEINPFVSRAKKDIISTTFHIKDILETNTSDLAIILVRKDPFYEWILERFIRLALNQESLFQIVGISIAKNHRLSTRNCLLRMISDMADFFMLCIYSFFRLFWKLPKSPFLH